MLFLQVQGEGSIFDDTASDGRHRVFPQRSLVRPAAHRSLDHGPIASPSIEQHHPGRRLFRHGYVFYLVPVLFCQKKSFVLCPALSSDAAGQTQIERSGFPTTTTLTHLLYSLLYRLARCVECVVRVVSLFDHVGASSRHSDDWLDLSS